MWGWADLFHRNTSTYAVPATTAYVHEPGLYAAWWEYQTDHGETHRLTCSHLHTRRSQAEQCASSINAAVDRMLREHTTINPSYVTQRLARHDHQYLGVLKEDEIV